MMILRRGRDDLAQPQPFLFLLQRRFQLLSGAFVIIFTHQIRDATAWDSKRSQDAVSYTLVIKVSRGISAMTIKEIFRQDIQVKVDDETLAADDQISPVQSH